MIYEGLAKAVRSFSRMNAGSIIASGIVRLKLFIQGNPNDDLHQRIDNTSFELAIDIDSLCPYVPAIADRIYSELYAQL